MGKRSKDVLPPLPDNDDSSDEYSGRERDAVERVVDFARSGFLGALSVSAQNREVHRARLLGVLELKKKIKRRVLRKKAEWRF